jgi:type II secretory pathway component PulF
VLRERGLTITQMAPVAASKAGSFRARRRARRDEGEITSFTRELATLLQVGIPLLSAIQTLAKQHRGSFRAVVEQLGDQVATGVGLAEAMEQQGAYFDELSVSIVRVGESTGSLDAALKRLSGFREKGRLLRSRITTALLYPSVVGVVGLSVAVFLMVKVVPDLLATLSQAGKDLPTPTLIVKAISDFIRQWWWALLVGMGATVAGLRAVLRTERGREVLSRFVLRVPVLGELVRKENTSRMAVMMSALLQSGLQFVDAVRITRQTIPNRVFRSALEDYEAAVTAGRDVAGPLEASGVFAPMVVQMLAVGQQAGQLEEMLDQLAEAYDQQVAMATQRLTAVLEPLLIVLLALLVGFIAFATILPILEVSNAL